MPGVSGDGKWGTFPKGDTDRAAVDAAFTHWMTSLDRDEALGKCEAAQVPCGAVYGVDEIFECRQYRAPKNIRFIEDPRTGVEVALQDTVPRLSATPGSIDALGPALGADNPTTEKSIKSFSACRQARSAHWRKPESSDRRY